MPRKPDTSIIGQTYSNLQVVRLTDERNSYGRLLYECNCILCGKKRLATKANLKKNEIRDCGNHQTYNDITGKRFGKLEVLYVTDKKSNTKKRCKIWHCKCDCGNECDVSYADLKSGNVKSCGCLHIEKTKELFVDGTAPFLLVENKLRETNTSGATGVWYDKEKSKWCAEIMFKRKKYYLGRYEKKEYAVKARKTAEQEIFGNFLEWYQNEYPEKWEKLQKKRK